MLLFVFASVYSYEKYEAAILFFHVTMYRMISIKPFLAAVSAITTTHLRQYRALSKPASLDGGATSGVHLAMMKDP